MRAHPCAGLSFEPNAAFLRVVEAVDDIEHRRLAGTVRPDDRANFAFADVEGNVADCLNAAKRERHVLDR
jgi:hypothetical protein